jgi:hypothetical protein
MTHNEGLQDINKSRPEGKHTTETRAMHLQQISKQQTEPRKGRISQVRETKMMEDTSHLKGTSAQ